LIYQKGQVTATVTDECDMGGNMIVQGVAVIPRAASGDSTFKEIKDTDLTSATLILALC
jgi:hypothetical protein